MKKFISIIIITILTTSPVYSAGSSNDGGSKVKANTPFGSATIRIKKAKKLLGYQPEFNISTGMDEAIDWYVQNSSK